MRNKEAGHCVVTFSVFRYTTLKAEFRSMRIDKLGTFKGSCYQRTLRISSIEHVTNLEVVKMNEREGIMKTEERKMLYFSHVMKLKSYCEQ